MPYLAVISKSRRLFSVPDQSKSFVMEYVGMGYWKPAVGVTLDHDLDKRLVDEIHLRLAVAVGKVQGLPPTMQG